MTVETTQPSGEVPVTTEPVVTEPAETQPRTVEEVEAEYKARISGKDKAHAAEAEALRQENARLKEADDLRRKAEEEARTANMTADQRAQEHIKTLTQQMEDKDRAHMVELRKIKYPTVASELDEAVLLVTDESKLAGLEAKLSGSTAAVPPPSLIDPNSSVRQNGTTPDVREKTTDELKADLAKQSAAFAEEIAQGR